MQKLKNKTMAILIVAILIISIGTSMMLAPNALAANPSVATFAFISVAPDPVGLGQSVTIGMWLGLTPPTASGPYGDRWEGFTVAVTKPDGTTETLGPFTSDDTGGTYTIYTPTQLGNYSFVFNYPGQTLAGKNLAPGTAASIRAFIGYYYQPSISNMFTLEVQQEPVLARPITPLPTSWWQTPVNAQNVNLWYSLTGNWLGLGNIFSGNTGNYNFNGNYNPYTTAPKTAHILWTKPAAFGGVLGGEFGGDTTSNYYSTSQYEPKFAPVIINGVLYYTQYPGSSTNPSDTIAIDLFTGKTLWTLDALKQLPSTSINQGNGSTLSVATGDFNTLSTAGIPTILRCGQVFDYLSPNQYGALAYIWTTGTPAQVASATNIRAGTITYNMFDAMTGDYILSIVNGSAMTLTTDKSGSLIGYYVDAASNTLNCWNSTKCIPMASAGWRWFPPQGGILPFNTGLMWSVPLATNISGVPLPTTFMIGRPGAATGGGIDSEAGIILLYQIAPGPSFFNTGFQIEAAHSTTTGQQLWITNRTQTPYTRVDISPVSNGIYVEINQDTAAIAGYSIRTGAQLWTKTLPNVNPYNSIGCYEDVAVNGTLYEYGFGGDVFAIDMATGNILWQTNTNTLHGDAGVDTPYGVWPLWSFELASAADGVLFIPEGHEYSPPLFHHANQLAINMTNGELVWKILAFDVTNPAAIAYGVMTTLNAYDNQIYAYGKGPSAMTVEAPMSSFELGKSVVIRGTITDISAGTQQDAVAANFPNGVPVIADESMSPWMEYVYMQQSKPTNATGVTVKLEVVDANGNYRTIGTTTSDASGKFSYTWKPDIEGTYYVIATFAGSESYWPSNAETSFVVDPATPTHAPTQAPAQSTADMYFVPAVAGIIVAFVIVVALQVLMLLKKRP
jgi:hypothetical protein